MTPDRDERPTGRVPFTQLNIVICVDVGRLMRTGDPSTSIGLVDNCPASAGKGGTELRTACRRGQVLNWIVYPVDGERRDDGSWPVHPGLVAVDPLDEAARGPCLERAIYGRPDEMRSDLTPIYAYWAGFVRPDAAPGLHPYRLIVACETADRRSTRRFELVGPALEILAPEPR